MPAVGGLATFGLWTMTPSSVTLLIVWASYLEWRLSPWAGRVLRVRTGRTATGTSLSTTEGVFNGGAWLEVDGRRSDVHYRGLDTIDREIAASREGRSTSSR
jgi:hypothetical protein